MKSWTSDKPDGLFKGADALAVCSGRHDENQSYSKTSCLHDWLFGAYFADFFIIICAKDIHFLGSTRKIALLQPLQKSEESFSIHLHTLKKDDTVAVFDAVKRDIAASRQGKQLGTLSKEKIQPGTFTALWQEFLSSSGFEQIDISAGIGKVFALKDSSEQEKVRMASSLSHKAMSWFQSQMENLIEKEKTIAHSAFASKVEKQILEKFADFKISGVQKDEIDLAYTPIVMSGSKFDLKLSAQSDDSPFNPSVIITSIGVRYSSYCSNLSRTFLINSSPTINANYKLLVHAFDEGLKEMVPKKKCCDVYNAVQKYIKEKAPQLADSLLKNFGSGIGLEFKETFAQLTAQSTRVIEAGMVFNFRVGFENLTNTDAKSTVKTYALLVADTILVTAEGNSPLTSECEKQFKQVSYTFNTETEQDDRSGRAKPAPVALPDEPVGARRTRPPEQTAVVDDPEHREHQKKLADELNRQAQQRLLGQKRGRQADSEQSVNLDHIVAYENVTQMPKASPNKIHVDMDRQCVLLPINGTLVPFHIATIKNVTNPEETNQGATNFTLRINFVSPPSSESWVTEAINQEKAFVKQLSFRCSSSANFNNIFRQIKELRKRYGQKVAEIKDKEDLIEQADLVLCKGKPHARLRDVQMRPNMPGARRTQGELQAHQNGFRFVSNKGQQVDMLYSNVKHAFLQPAHNDVIVLVHFNLKHPIMLGRKKLEDIQFFSEVMEQSSDLSVTRGDAYDEEQHERQMKTRENKRFKDFCDSVSELHLLEFDAPYPELGFMGVAGKTNSLIQPTAHCVVDLMEWPPTVIDLSEIELVSLERVDFSLRNFDMVIVFKDYKKPVQTITSIPKDKIDDIKRWLNQMNIKYYEGRISLQWASIMKHITADPKAFFEEGGWSFLGAEKSDSDAGSDSDKSEEFKPTQKEDEVDSEGSDSEYSAADSDEDSVASLSEDEEGMDWDQLEQQAKEEDAGMSEDEEDRPSKKQKSTSTAPSKKQTSKK
eukprot:c9530_g1_i1.p1 GENE.c9530_g1_i1~~c9530_g1_i1.p1  ORF type:complete len:1032 (+),score=277.64 c9530_g1_i1:108-3098(+)